MAATKKSTTTSRKKPTTTRKTTPKTKATAKSTRSQSASTSRKPAAKRAPAKSRSATKVRRSSTPVARSFRVDRNPEPFMSLRVTVQTLYWVILGAAVVGLALWVLNIHNKVQSIYDEIDQSTIMQQELDAKELQMLREQAERNQQQD